MLPVTSRKKPVMLGTSSSVPSFLPPVDSELQCHCRPGDLDQCICYRNHGIPHLNPLPVLYSRFEHPLFLGRSPALRTDLRHGTGQGSQYLHDAYCSVGVDFGNPTFIALLPYD